jgi:hypothetical protein
MEEIEKRPFHRPKGSLNKATAKTRQLLQTVVEGNLERINAELEALHGKEYIAAIVSLAEFVLPKLNRVEYIDENAGPRVVRVIHSLQPPEKAVRALDNIENAEFKIIEP